MPTRDELIAGLKAADAAGQTADAQHFADLIQRLPEPIPAGRLAAVKDADKITGDKLTGARASEFLNGGLLGWGDELIGAVGGVDSAIRGKNSRTGQESLGGGYDSAVGNVRRGLAQYEDERPLEALGVNALGGLPLIALGGASAAAKTSLKARILSAAKTGAQIGAVAGAGSADGDVGKRVGGGLLGGIAGGGLGTLLPLIPTAAQATMKLVNRAKMSPEEFAAHYVSKALTGDALDTVDALSANKPLIKTGGNSVTAAAEQGALSGKGRQVAEKYFGDQSQAREGTLLGAIKRTVSDIPFYNRLDELSTQRATDAKPLYQDAYAAQYRRTPKLVDLSKRPAVGGAAKAAITRVLNDPDMNPDEVRTAIGSVFGNDLNDLTDEQASQRLTQAMGKRPIEFKVLDYIKRGLDNMASDPGASTEIRKLRGAWRDELKAINPKYQEALNAWAGPSRTLEALEEGRSFDTGDHSDPEAITRLLGTMGDSEREAYQIGVSRRLQDLASGAKSRTPSQNTALSLSNAISGNSTMKRRLEAALGAAGAQPDAILARNGWKASNGGYRNSTKPGQILNFDNNSGVWSLEQASKSGKSTSLLNSGADTGSLETAITGQPRRAETGPQNVDDLIAVAHDISDTAAKQKQVIGGSQTARRQQGSEDFDALGEALGHIGEGAKAAKGGVWNFISHALGKSVDRALTGLSEERRAAVSRLIFSNDPAERQAGIEMIDKIRSGKKVDTQLYKPKIAPRIPGVVITGVNAQGDN